MINLNSEVLDILALPSGTHRNHEFCLQLVTNKRSFIIACKDQNELDLWLSNLLAIHRALRYANGTFVTQQQQQQQQQADLRL